MKEVSFYVCFRWAIVLRSDIKLRRPPMFADRYLEEIARVIALVGGKHNHGEVLLLRRKWIKLIRKT